MTKQIQHRVALCLTLFVALFLRLAAVSYVPARPVSDAKDYQDLATRLVQHHRFETANGTLTAARAPGYPLILAAIYSVTGINLHYAYVAQAVIGTVVVLEMFFLAGILQGEQAGLLAAVFTAIYPGFIWLSRALLSENFALLFTPLILIALIKLTVSEKKMDWAFYLGVFLGVATLIRSATIFLVFAVLIMLVVRKLPRAAVIAAVLCAAVLVPSIARNSLIFHRLTGLSTVDGITLYASYWPPVQNGNRNWGNEPFSDPVVVAALAQSEPDASSQLKRATLNRLLQNPSQFFAVLPEKLLFAAIPLDWEVFPKPRSWNFCYIFVAVIAALGLKNLGSIEKSICCAFAAAFLMQTVVFYGSPRFRLPLEPMLILLAATTLTSAWNKLRNPQLRRSANCQQHDQS